MSTSTLQFSVSLQDCWCQAILSNSQADPAAAPTWSLINKQLFLRLKNRHRTRLSNQGRSYAHFSG